MKLFGLDIVYNEEMNKDKIFIIDEKKFREKFFYNEPIFLREIERYDYLIRSATDVFKKLDLIKEKYIKCDIEELLENEWRLLHLMNYCCNINRDYFINSTAMAVS